MIPTSASARGNDLTAHSFNLPFRPSIQRPMIPMVNNKTNNKSQSRRGRKSKSRSRRKYRKKNKKNKSVKVKNNKVNGRISQNQKPPVATTLNVSSLFKKTLIPSSRRMPLTYIRNRTAKLKRPSVGPSFKPLRMPRKRLSSTMITERTNRMIENRLIQNRFPTRPSTYPRHSIRHSRRKLIGHHRAVIPTPEPRPHARRKLLQGRNG